MNYDKIKENLHNNVCEVVFTKVNGTKRKMIATLKPELLPIRENKKVVESARKDNATSIPVFDLENKGWRSFRVDAVQSLEIVK